MNLDFTLFCARGFALDRRQMNHQWRGSISHHGRVLNLGLIGLSNSAICCGPVGHVADNSIEPHHPLVAVRARHVAFLLRLHRQVGSAVPIFAGLAVLVSPSVHCRHASFFPIVRRDTAATRCRTHRQSGGTIAGRARRDPVRSFRFDLGRSRAERVYAVAALLLLGPSG